MLEDLGNLGDFIGGIAVVVSLAYLALQIRQNTASVKAATIQSASHVLAATLDMFAREPETLRVYHAGTHDFEHLSKEEQFHFATIMGVMLHRIEPLVAQTEEGLLAAESWDRAANRLRGAFALQGTVAWWQRGKYVFNSQLQNWVDSQIVDKPSNGNQHD